MFNNKRNASHGNGGGAGQPLILVRNAWLTNDHIRKVKSRARNQKLSLRAVRSAADRECTSTSMIALGASTSRGLAR